MRRLLSGGGGFRRLQLPQPLHVRSAVAAGVCSTGEGLISGAVSGGAASTFAGFAAAAGAATAGAVALASAFFDFLLETAPYLVMNFSTRPSVSTNFCLPVKNG